MQRGRVLIGLVVAFAALVLAPLIEDGLGSSGIVVVALLVAVGLVVIWRALAGPLG